MSWVRDTSRDEIVSEEMRKAWWMSMMPPPSEKVDPKVGIPRPEGIGAEKLQEQCRTGVEKHGEIVENWYSPALPTTNADRLSELVEKEARRYNERIFGVPVQPILPLKTAAEITREFQEIVARRKAEFCAQFPPLPIEPLYKKFTLGTDISEAALADLVEKTPSIEDKPEPSSEGEKMDYYPGVQPSKPSFVFNVDGVEFRSEEEGAFLTMDRVREIAGIEPEVELFVRDYAKQTKLILLDDSDVLFRDVYLQILSV